MADLAKKETLDFEKNLDFARIDKKENGNDVDVEVDNLIAANV